MTPDIILWLSVVVFLNLLIGLLQLSILLKNKFRKIP
jgi:hypothetical protein